MNQAMKDLAALKHLRCFTPFGDGHLVPACPSCVVVFKLLQTCGEVECNFGPGLGRHKWNCEWCGLDLLPIWNDDKSKVAAVRVPDSDTGSGPKGDGVRCTLCLELACDGYCDPALKAAALEGELAARKTIGRPLILEDVEAKCLDVIRTGGGSAIDLATAILVGCFGWTTDQVADECGKAASNG